MINKLIKFLKVMFKKETSTEEVKEINIEKDCPYKMEPSVVYSDGVLENRIEINFNFERVE